MRIDEKWRGIACAPSRISGGEAVCGATSVKLDLGLTRPPAAVFAVSNMDLHMGHCLDGWSPRFNGLWFMAVLVPGRTPATGRSKHRHEENSPSRHAAAAPTSDCRNTAVLAARSDKWFGIETEPFIRPWTLTLQFHTADRTWHPSLCYPGIPHTGQYIGVVLTPCWTRENNGAAERPYYARLCCDCPESWASTTGRSSGVPCKHKKGNECNHQATFEEKRAHLLEKASSRTTAFMLNDWCGSDQFVLWWWIQMQAQSALEEQCGPWFPILSFRVFASCTGSWEWCGCVIWWSRQFQFPKI